MNLRKNLRGAPEPHSSALNDILFILLLFFLVISTLANPNVIQLTIPQAESDTRSKQTVTVSIDPQQRFYLGTQPVHADSLFAAISHQISAADYAEPTVVIHADKQADAESIVTVMRAAKALKLRTVLAVEEPH